MSKQVVFAVAIALGVSIAAPVAGQVRAGRPDSVPQDALDLGAVPPDEAEEPIDTQRDTAAPPEVLSLSGISEDYRIGPGDALDIQVVGQTDLTQSLRVSASGEISVPMLGLVPVNELTAFEVEVELAERLRQKGLVKEAEVLVTIAQYQAKPIYVWGAVVNPGEFVMSHQLTTVDAVLLAGGLTPNAADEGFLHRRPENSGQAWPVSQFADTAALAAPGTEVLKVDLRAMREGRFLSASIPIRSGDVLVVPLRPLKMFFIVGEVAAPRNYRYPDGRTLMASQAISMAGGPLPTAAMSNGILIRYDPQGQRTELKIDYAAILNGRQLDFPIQPTDIIFIPGHRIKTIAHGLLQMTDTMLMQQSFQIGRDVQMPERDIADR